MSSETADTTRSLPFLGYGLRLRKEYLTQLTQQQPEVDWFEIISESYLGESDQTLSQLDRVRERYPLVMHGISLAIGSPWPIDEEYLTQLESLMRRFRPEWISDHLCWSGADDIQGKLLPLPYTEEMLDHVVKRVTRIQDRLGCRILLENVPTESAFAYEAIPEPEFIREVAIRSDSLILLDIANLHANSVNQGFDPLSYIDTLPADRVQQFHLLGATILCCPDEISSESADPVWQLYSLALERLGPVSTMIDRGDTIPSLDEMVKESAKARCGANLILNR